MRRRIASALVLATIVVAASSASAASKVEDRLAGKVALSKAALPGKKGDRAWGQAAAKSSRGRAVFWQDAKTGAWTIHYAAVVKRPVLDATISIFDVSHGKKLVLTKDKMLYKESRIVTGSLALDRDDVVDANRRLLMVVESGGQVMAERVFYIQGKVERRSKNRDVTFTADEVGAAN
ncbi:MAG TPA: hypothetical protein VFU21_08775 [Kofleriaceae bacterium]|nr:hypothetical protein [Kofleriaceae bacterium]